MAGVFTLSPGYRPRPQDFVSGGPAILSGIASGIETAGKMHFAARQKQLDRKASDREMALRSLVKAGHPGAQRELEGMAGLEHADLEQGQGISDEEARMFDRYMKLSQETDDPDVSNYYGNLAMNIVGGMPWDARQTVPGARRPARVEDHNAYLRKELKSIIAGPSGTRMLAGRIAEQEGVDPRLMDAHLQEESGYDPQAKGSAGEIGLGQLMPETARDLGVDPNRPGQNLHGTARYIRQNLDRFGNVPDAVTAYQSGAGNVERGTVGPRGRAYRGRVLSHLQEEPGTTGYLRRGEGGSVVPAESRMAGRLFRRKREADPYADTQAREQAKRDYEIQQGMSPKSEAEYNRGLAQDARAEQNAQNQRYTQRRTRLKEGRDRAFQEQSFFSGKLASKGQETYDPNTGSLVVTGGLSDAERTKFQSAADRAEKELYAHDAAIDAFDEMWDDGKPLEKINETVERILRPKKK